ncbi:MAG: DUF1501 domain-containing protein [Luteolibacter sp.]
MNPITRRRFLELGAAAASAGAFALPRTQASQPVIQGRTLVAVFLRGGIDGLNLIIPHGDKNYYSHRSSLAIPRPSGADGSAMDLDGFFGLHPATASLMPMFRDGRAAALQAVGYAENTRSHFEEQDTWETGVVGNSLSSDGWLNRHLASSTGHGVIRAVAIGGNLPRILRGRAPAYAIRSVNDLAMPKTHADAELLRAALETAYCSKPDPARAAATAKMLAKTAAATLEGTRQLESIAKAGYQAAHGAVYPNTTIARQFQEAARLIKAKAGTEVIQIDYGGWDTHNNQGAATGGYANRLRELSEAMAAFSQDLGDDLRDVLVLTLSDFGRTVRENGTRGTDHGWANCMIAIGGSLAKQAKPVLGEWPGLDDEQLHQGRDLRHTTDFRDVLGEVVKKHLGNHNINAVIPGYQNTKVGLL